MAKKHSEGKREGMAGYGTYGRIPVTALEMELLGMICEYEDWLSRLGAGEMDTVAKSDIDMARLDLVRGLVAKMRDSRKSIAEATDEDETGDDMASFIEAIREVRANVQEMRRELAAG